MFDRRIKNVRGERCCEVVHDHTGPLRVVLPDYQAGVEFYVSGIARRRNYPNGPVLTLAAGYWIRTDIAGGRKHDIRDVCTAMRLADVISHHHTQPINHERRYGVRGRRAPVGRRETVPPEMVTPLPPQRSVPRSLKNA